MLGTLKYILTKTRKFYKVAAYVTFLFIFSLAFLTTQTYAIELTSNVTLLTGNHKSTINYSAVSGFSQNCSRTSSYLIGGGGNETPCYLSSISLSVPDRNDYKNGDFIVQEVFLHNTQVNNSSDIMARINSYSVSSSGNAGADLVDVKFESLDDSSGKITFTSRVWQAGNLYSMTYGFDNYAAFGLFSSEWIASGYTTVWRENNDVDYSTSLGNISSAVSSIESAAWGINNNAYYNGQQLVTINTNLGTINGGINDIKQLISNTSSAIDNQTQAMNDIHDDEVERIEGGISEGQSQVEGLDTSLSPVNPITWLFQGLEVHNCYDISQLAGFLHAPSNMYCSWFSQSTRNIISPVINLFATIVIIGFAYSWLKKGGL